MKILISNDDGVHAPGLAALAAALSSVADCRVVAPDRNRSGASNSLTLHRPLRLRTLENGFISVEGTPSDCVHLALTGVIDFQPDVVVSGINDGSNMGDDVLYSGTVAAAMEGRFLGLPAIAFSLAGYDELHYDTAAEVAKRLILQVEQYPISNRVLLNVNIPDVSLEAIQGMEVTRTGSRRKAERTELTKDPRGREVYWIGRPGAEEDAGPGTDFYAIRQKLVSITPIQVDLTYYAKMQEMSDWLCRMPWE